MLSVVIPAYNEEKMIDKTAATICDLLNDAQIKYELLFIDDGSSDTTWEKIKNISAVMSKRENSFQPFGTIRGVSFSRNFGKESAIFAGLIEAKGDCVVVIDCDLQHPPEKIIEMYDLWEKGYEIVEGIKRNRGKESGLHAFAARCFYKLMSDSIRMDMSHASDYKLLDRKAVNVLINMPEKNSFFRALSNWVGFKSTTVEYDVQERQEGKAKWSTRALIKYAISNITSFTSAPMHIVTMLGSIMFIVALVMSSIALVQKFTGVALGGFTTVIILQCFTSSIIMISIGIIGYYISKIYDEIKGRPRYVVTERTIEQ